eukprot:SAG31_NODE_1339_length_8727_cov_6.433125_9_plen_83_part_00
MQWARATNQRRGLRNAVDQNNPIIAVLPTKQAPRSLSRAELKDACRATLSRLVPYFSRLKSRISRIVAQKRESNFAHRRRWW